MSAPNRRLDPPKEATSLSTRELVTRRRSDTSDLEGTVVVRHGGPVAVPPTGGGHHENPDGHPRLGRREKNGARENDFGEENREGGVFLGRTAPDPAPVSISLPDPVERSCRR